MIAAVFNQFNFQNVQKDQNFFKSNAAQDNNHAMYVSMAIFKMYAMTKDVLFARA